MEEEKEALRLMQPNLFERLRHNILFENISDKDFSGVERKLVERHYRAGKVILKDEGPGDKLCLLVEGRVKIVKKTRFGEYIMLALLHHGDCFGELELIDGRPRSSSVVAVEDTITFELEKQDFVELMATCAPFTLRLLHLMSVRLRAIGYHFVQEIDENYQRSALEVNKLKRLIEAAKNVNSTLNLDKLLTVIMETALKIVEADTGTLYLIDYDRQELWSKVLKGTTLVEIRLPIGKGIAGYVAATGDTLNIPDAYLDHRFDPEWDEKSGYRTKTILCMPIRNKENRIIGVLQLLNKLEGLFTEDDENFIAALSVHSSIAIENARLYEQERLKIAMEKDLLAARQVQMSLLPKAPPAVEGYDMAGQTLSAKMVGGDYFDFIPMRDKRMIICLGDVSGKGLPAALLMANLQATLRGQIVIEAAPKDWITSSNRLLHQNTTPEKFITLFFGLLDRECHTLTYCNAGHDHPFLFSGRREVRRLSAGGIVLAVVEEFPFQEETVILEPGDLLVIHSDGITDAFNARRQRFGEKRLAGVISEHRHKTAAEILSRVYEAVKDFTGEHPQFDDMTLVVVKRSRE